MSKTAKPTITFKYLNHEPAPPAYVNGVHGSISPRGELVMHFYHEHPALPETLTHEIRPDGTIGNTASQTPPDLGTTLVRQISGSIVLTYDSARMIHQWLGERLREMEIIQSTDTIFTDSSDSGVVH